MYQIGPGSEGGLWMGQSEEIIGSLGSKEFPTISNSGKKQESQPDSVLGLSMLKGFQNSFWYYL